MTELYSIVIDEKQDSKVAIVISEGIVISDVPNALDLMSTISFNHDCNKLLMKKSNICKEFFDLSTGVAGEILQKYTNYRLKIAIVGDFSEGSQSLQDFIYECNKGGNIAFVDDESTALQVLHRI